MKYFLLVISILFITSCATTESQNMSVAKTAVSETKEVVKKKCKRSKKTTGVRTTRTNCHIEPSSQQ